MSGSQPDEGVLYKRVVAVPQGLGVDMLLQKWNPGLPDRAIVDLAFTVLRWNGLTGFENLAPGQELVIPTVVPPGMTPREWRQSQKDWPRRQPFSVGQAHFEQAAAPDPLPEPAAPGRAARAGPQQGPAGEGVA
jgi:hypothetical protein